VEMFGFDLFFKFILEVGFGVNLWGNMCIDVDSE
jgi:hypothetical protein